MSMQNRVTVDCPTCGQAQDAFYWSSLNVQLSPEAKADFFAGKINVFECTACHAQTILEVPFLYHDMTLKFCVQYYPISSLDEEDTFRSLKPDGSSIADFDGTLAETRYLLHPHIVFRMQEALTYVVFREKLAEYHQPHGHPGYDEIQRRNA